MIKINAKSPEDLLEQVIKRLGHGYDSIFLLQENHIISRPNKKRFLKIVFREGAGYK